MAAIWTHFKAFLSGGLEPFWPHLILIGGAIAAEVAVAVGIIMESPKEKTRREIIGMVLVFGGVALGALFTVSLFVFDEGISTSQQSKIVTLESRLAARSINDEELASMVGKLRQFSGQTFMIVPYWHDKESQDLANRIWKVLTDAGWKYEPPTGAVFLVGVVAGVTVGHDKGAPEPTAGASTALVAALNDGHIDAEADDDTNNPTPTPKIAISVGIKP